MSSCLLFVSCCVYTGLLRAYPAEFRNAFGSEMMQVFRDECRASISDHSLPCMIAFWMHILGDLLITASREQLAATDKWSFAVLCVVISLGVWIGLVDFRSNEVQNAVLLIVSSTFVFGLFMPRSAWRRAVPIGLGVPAIHYVAMWVGVKPPYPVQPGIYATFLAVIPALIGSYAGVFVRWLSASVAPSAAE